MSGTNAKDLDARAAAGETVVPGGTGGKSVEAQEHLAEGRTGRRYLSDLPVGKRCSKKELVHHGRSKGGQARSEQLGHDGYVEMGKKGGSATNDMAGGEAAEVAGRPIDDSKFTD